MYVLLFEIWKLPFITLRVLLSFSTTFMFPMEKSRALLNALVRETSGMDDSSGLSLRVVGFGGLVVVLEPMER